MKMCPIYGEFCLYVGHPISSDNGLISQKLLLLKIRILLPIACGHGCCLLVFEIFVIQICIQLCESPKSCFLLIFVWGGGGG